MERREGIELELKKTFSLKYRAESIPSKKIDHREIKTANHVWIELVRYCKVNRGVAPRGFSSEAKR